MALRKRMNFEGVTETRGDGWSIVRGNEQVDFGHCYIKVEQVTASKAHVVARLSIRSEEHGAMRYAEVSFAPNLDGANFIKQAYDYIKTLEEYRNVEDC